MYYGPNLYTIPYPYGWFVRPEELQTPYVALQEALRIIRETAASSQNVEAFYKRLLELAPSEEDRTVLTSIIQDERNHYQYLREVYLAFTGQEIPASAPITVFDQPESYESGLKKALFHKWDIAQNHGIILAAMPTGHYQNLLAKVAVDNVSHATKFNYLLMRVKGLID